MNYGYLAYFIFVLLGMGFILYTDIYTMSKQFKRDLKMRPTIYLFLNGFILTIMLSTVYDNFILHYIVERYNLLMGMLFTLLCAFIYDIFMVLVYNINLINYRKKGEFDKWLKNLQNQKEKLK